MYLHDPSKRIQSFNAIQSTSKNGTELMTSSRPLSFVYSGIVGSRLDVRFLLHIAAKYSFPSGVGSLGDFLRGKPMSEQGTLRLIG